MLRSGKPLQLFNRVLADRVSVSHDILDIGTSSRFAKELRPLQSLFTDKRYVAAGYNPLLIYGEYNCDCHQDIEDITFGDNQFDLVICIEVIEHVQHPERAVSEILRILRPGGSLFLTAPFLLQYHGKSNDQNKSQDHGNYPDFWRFTHEGLICLLHEYSEVKVLPLGGPIEFRVKQFLPELLTESTPIRKLIDLVDTPQVGRATVRHLATARKSS